MLLNGAYKSLNNNHLNERDWLPMKTIDSWDEMGHGKWPSCPK